MKTRILATALERGRVAARSAQAWGFVSRMMTSNDGAGPKAGSDRGPQVGVDIKTFSSNLIVV